MDKVKFSFAFIGIVLFALAGWLIGARLEHSPDGQETIFHSHTYTLKQLLGSN
jgi:hypothetical protein